MGRELTTNKLRSWVQGARRGAKVRDSAFFQAVVAAVRPQHDPALPQVVLPPRLEQVLALVSCNRTNRQIAIELAITERTVG